VLRRDLGRDPTIAELAAQTHIPPEKVKTLLTAGLPEIELDAHISDGTSLAAFLPDDQSAPPDGPLREADDHRLFLRLMATLNDRERFVLQRRFGLDDTPPETLDQVAQRLHLSRERVRQIEKRALERLRRQASAA
jgi:RNA polymerase sigma factor (sigma-70 family)